MTRKEFILSLPLLGFVAKVIPKTTPELSATTVKHGTSLVLPNLSRSLIEKYPNYRLAELLERLKYDDVELPTSN